MTFYVTPALEAANGVFPVVPYLSGFLELKGFSCFVFFGSQEQQTIATASLNKSEIPFFFFLHFSFESLYLVLTRNSVIYYVFLAANFSSSCFFFTICYYLPNSLNLCSLKQKAVQRALGPNLLKRPANF